MQEQMLDLFVLNPRADEAAIMLARRGQDTAIINLNIDDNIKSFSAFAGRVDAAVQGATRPTAAEMKQLGETLFQRFFSGAARSLYDRLPDGPVSIQIVSNDPNVLRVPWEYIAPPDKQPVPHPERCVVRVHPICSAANVIPARRRQKLRVLLAVAEPANEPGVGWGDIESELRRVFRANTDDVAELTIIQAATPQAIQRALTRKNYDVFHFLGHGKVVAGVSHLVLLDVATGASQNMSGTVFAPILAGRNLRLCILSACQSGAGDTSKSSFVNVATSLLEAGVPAVVANQTAIPSDTVAPFVGALYASLIANGNIDAAVMEGRVALHTALQATVKEGEAVFEWGIPTLYRLPGAGQLFKRVK